MLVKVWDEPLEKDTARICRLRHSVLYQFVSMWCWFSLRCLHLTVLTLSRSWDGRYCLRSDEDVWWGSSSRDPRGYRPLVQTETPSLLTLSQRILLNLQALVSCFYGSTQLSVKSSKVCVPLHAMKALGGRSMTHPPITPGAHWLGGWVGIKLRNYTLWSKVKLRLLLQSGNWVLYNIWNNNTCKYNCCPQESASILLWE